MNTLHLKKYFIINFKKFFGALLVFGLLFSSIPAPAFAIIYQPGATLNPACLPTDTNCGVEAPFAQNGNAFNALATLGVTDNNALRFITNNAEVMRILANGNVGIGTASPSSRFAVSTSAVTSTAYTTAVSTTGLTNDESFVSSTLRQHFASTTITDTGANGIAKVRLTFNASTGTTTVGKAYIGVATTASSSDPFDFASAPTQITFNGSVSTSIASSSTAISDTISVNIPNGSNILVSVFTSSGGWKSKALEAGKQGYSKAGDDAATVDATGYTTATSTYAISLIEEGTDSTTAASEIFNISTSGAVNIGSAAAGGSILLTQGTTATSSVLGLATAGTRMRITAGQSDTQDNTQGASIDLHSNTAGAAGRLDLVAGGTTGALTFWTGGDQRGTWDASGNLGVGVTSPTANFQVGQGILGAGTVSNTASGTTVTGVGTQFLNTFKVGDTIQIGADIVAITAIASNISMTTAAITSAHTNSTYFLTGGTRFSVLGNGNVGIGTAVPSGRLHVGAVNSANALVVDATSGNLGVGTNVPDSVLHVAGAAAAAGSNALQVLNVVGGAGGTHNGTAAGVGSALTLTSGVGGNIGVGANLTAGAGGLITISGGTGGSGAQNFNSNRNGGAGGNLLFSGGTGGGVGNDGAGGGFSGAGGNVFVVGGAPGAAQGNSGTGANGNVYLAVNSAGTAIGNVGIRTNAAANVLTIGVDGTVAAPAISLGATADSDTGIFHPAADALAFSAGGVERLRMTANAAVSIVGQDQATAGANAAQALTITGGLGGSLNNVTDGVSGNGGAISLTGGQGRDYIFANNTVANTGGVGGAVNITAGRGTSGDNTFGNNRRGGSGGALNLIAGAGGDVGAGGAGGAITGAGGSVYLAGGLAGTNLGGATVSAAGNVFLGVDSGGTARGNVGIRTNAAANVLTIGVDGTAAAPAIALGATADSDTGIFHPSADVLAFTAAGVEKLRVNTAGATVTGGLTVTAGATITGAAGPGGFTGSVGNPAPVGFTATGGAGGTANAGNTNGTYTGALGGGLSFAGGAGGDITFVNFTTGSATYGAGGGLNFTGGTGASGNQFTNISTTGGAGGGLTFSGGDGGTAGAGGGSGSVTGGVGGSLVLVGGTGGMSAASGNVLLAVTSGGTARGRVGIGTNAPSQILHVVRSTDGVVARFTDANGDCDINPTNTALVCASDISLKKNTVTMSDTLEKMLALNPILFDWNREEDGMGNHIGFIAQDVERLFPALVSTNEEGLKSLAYSNFAPILVSAMQEQFGGLQGLKFDSTTDYAQVFSSSSTLDELAQAGASKNFIADPIGYIRERVEQGIKIVRTLVTEKLVAVNGYFKRIFANELCLTDSSGELVCVTGEDLKQIGGQTPTAQLLVPETPVVVSPEADTAGQASAPQEQIVEPTPVEDVVKETTEEVPVEETAEEVVEEVPVEQQVTEQEPMAEPEQITEPVSQPEPAVVEPVSQEPTSVSGE